ncbi:MAG: C4-dicarboxylate transporter DctA [Pyrinomonadaceae bacterium]
MISHSKGKFYKLLYFQVLTAIILGAWIGFLFPEVGAGLKPLGDAFIKVIKMLIAPIIFLTVVVGIAGIGDMKKVGRVGLKALVYFEIITTFALVTGLVVVKYVRPGAGINADPATLAARAVEQYATTAKAQSATDFLLHIIHDTVVGAFAQGEILQVLFFAILFGLALAKMGERGAPLVKTLDRAAHVFFGIIAIIMRAAPIGAFGAMAFTVGKYGIATLLPLAKVMLCVYVTCALFIFGVLGTIARLNKFSLWKLLRYIKEEILVVLGTSSSESVLPRLMAKLEHLGCSKSVVGLVVPSGYSFNLDGTSIYLTIAAIFVAQATNTELSLIQEVTILLVLMLTSKGAATVTGGGFITGGDARFIRNDSGGRHHFSHRRRPLYSGTLDHQRSVTPWRRLSSHAGRRIRRRTRASSFQRHAAARPRYRRRAVGARRNAIRF